MSRTARTAQPGPEVGGLAFHAKGGPLLAVVGLCGGAGASTLTYLVALAAARASTAPVLACDTGGPTGGLSLYAGTQTTHSLADAAERLAAGKPLAGGLVATGRNDLRLIASGPEFLAHGDADGIQRVLGDAQLAHALTVVDCGTLTRDIDRQALTMASHIAWVLPASVSGVRRAQRVLDVVHQFLPGREVLVARADPAGRKPPMHELTALAGERAATLALVAHVPDLGENDPADALEVCSLALEGIGTVLRR
jgi:Flp pilus assembly CpaE family ATPase